MKAVIDRLAQGLDGAVRTIGAIGVASLAGIVAWVVFSRYLLGQTPRWSEELPRLILVWVTFIGMVSGFVRRSHFKAGILDMILPEGRARRATHLLAGICSGVFLIVLLVTGYKITLFTWHHETTAMSLPGGLFYLCLPIGAALSLIALILRGGRP
ncbi:TRAP transporter small permease [Celeribacter sp.]|jgi:TRAP-type C4-dicarboxylate transport system permease small subunit|uniref:TRAP transporter small permease n=1 Tax=unclassified Celeribacter TaxID=2618893 RepID=UPI003A8D58A4